MPVKRRSKYPSTRYTKRRRYSVPVGGRMRTMARTTFLKRSRIGRVSNPVHFFSRYTETAGNVNNISVTASKNLYITLPNTALGVGFGYAPCIGDIVSISEFSALYDQYKLLRAMFTFRLLTNPDAIETLGTSATTSSANFYPALWLMPDHDDIIIPTLASIRQCSKAKRYVLRPNAFIRYSIRPTSLTQVYDGVVTTAYSVNKPQWLDISQTGTPHYGLKGFVDTEGASSTIDSFIIAVECKLIFGMKGIR